MTAQNSPNTPQPTRSSHPSDPPATQQFATPFGGGLVLTVIGQFIAFFSFVSATPGAYSRSESGVIIGGLIAAVGLSMAIYGAWGAVKHIDALANQLLSK
ncbi:MAG: hypothetical protein Q4P05_06375 [Actinomycetaceae bacterium]|nr:hypothetical protein [Actinomycetaceae bacterium]